MIPSFVCPHTCIDEDLSRLSATSSFDSFISSVNVGHDPERFTVLPLSVSVSVFVILINLQWRKHRVSQG